MNETSNHLRDHHRHQHELEHEKYMNQIGVESLRHGQVTPVDHLHHHSTMRMTFSNFWDYNVVFFFDGWEIDSPEVYFAAWILIVCAVILTHYIRHLLLLLEVDMKDFNPDLPVLFSKGQSSFITSFLYYLKNKLSLSGIYVLLSTANYTIGLLLMLVAMTYNTGFFLALVIGYSVGSYLGLQWKQKSAYRSQLSNLDPYNKVSTGECHE